LYTKYKASEFRTFIHFGWVAFEQYMKSNYFLHLSLLASGVHLLSSNNINPDSIRVAKSNLIDFVHQFKNLYGERNMSSNVHDLLHLSDFCERFGPLYQFSCFSFESLNKEFFNLTQGTTKYEVQIANNFQVFKSLGTNYYNGSINHPKVKLLIESLLFNQNQEEQTIGTNIKIDKTQSNTVLKLFFGNTYEHVEFKKYIYKGKTKLSTIYSNYKTCDYLIMFKNDNINKYGCINYISVSKENQVNLLINELDIVVTNSNLMDELGFIKCFNYSQRYCIIKLDDFIDKCVLFSGNLRKYLIIFPNKYEYS
jgi:hypothetical protein